MFPALLLAAMAFLSPAEVPIDTFPSIERATHVTVPKNLDTIDTLVARALEAFEVPGAAIGIVVDGEVVCTKGYGLRNVEEKLPVNETTLFPIASCTKAINAFVLAQLVDRGLLSFEDRVKDYLPELRLWNRELTEELTIRHLLTHTSGLPAHNVLWYATAPEWTSSDLLSTGFLKRLQYLEPTQPTGKTFQYNNWMYAIAGLVAERALGSPWEQVIEQELLEPLGMERTNFSVAAIKQKGNYALPYAAFGENLYEVPFFDLSALGGAGALNSTAVDMVKWVALQLSDGSVEGTRFISEEGLQETHSVQIATPSPYDHAECILQGYTLGWQLSDYRGTRLLHHNGAPRGFRSNIALLPDFGIGVVVLSNSSAVGSHFVDSLSLQILDHFLECDDVDWIAYRAELLADSQRAKREARAQKLANRKRGLFPSHSLVDFEGNYSHPGYGTIRIRYERGTLVANYGRGRVPLSHWQENTFQTTLNVPDAMVAGRDCHFVLDAAGNISTLSIALEPALPPITFRRQVF